MSLRNRGSALFLLAVGGGMAGAFAVGSQLQKRGPVARPLTPVRVAEASERGSAASFPAGAPSDDSDAGTFEAVYELVQRNYTDALPTDTKLALGAAKAMVGSLEDPNSYFLNPSQRQLLEDENNGKFAGIGAGLFLRPVKKEGYTDFKIVVVAPLPGSPAEKAGLKPGDVIARVEGKYVLGYNPMVLYIKVAEKFENKAATDDELEAARKSTEVKLTTGVGFAPVQLALRGDDAVKSLAGKKSLKLTVERPGAAQPLTIDVPLGATQVSPVTSKTLPDGAGYLKVALFTESVPGDVQKALSSLPKERGLVLDLRGNPGGSFSAAQKVVGLLAGPGPFAVEIGGRDKKTTLTSGPGSRILRLSVLVNGGTGSTAEATAQALVERGGATLVGEKTFGDAIVQTLYKLGDGSGFTLRTGKLVSPKGVGWAWTGLTPKVALAPGTPEDKVLARASDALKTPVAVGN